MWLLSTLYRQRLLGCVDDSVLQLHVVHIVFIKRTGPPRISVRVNDVARVRTRARFRSRVRARASFACTLIEEITC